MKSSATSIAVIGGGITGVTTAYALAKRGFAVTLFEKNRYAAMETSFANGGQLSASNAEVWNHWSTILKGMKWMLKSDAPLLVNPKPSWHKLSWFWEFIFNIPHYDRNTVESARRRDQAGDQPLRCRSFPRCRHRRIQRLQQRHSGRPHPAAYRLGESVFPWHQHSPGCALGWAASHDAQHDAASRPR